MRNWPIALGALSIIANLPPLRGLDAVLVLDRDVFPKLYTRDILVWNDPRILANQDPKIVAALANQFLMKLITRNVSKSCAARTRYCLIKEDSKISDLPKCS